MDGQFVAQLFREVLDIQLDRDREQLLVGILQARKASNDGLRSLDTQWTEPILTFDPRW